MRLGQGGHGNYAASSPMDSIGAVAEAGARGSCIPGCSVEVEGLRFLQLPRCVDWIGDCWECSNRATSRSTQHVPPLSNKKIVFLFPLPVTVSIVTGHSRDTQAPAAPSSATASPVRARRPLIPAAAHWTHANQLLVLAWGCDVTTTLAASPSADVSLFRTTCGRH